MDQYERSARPGKDFEKAGAGAAALTEVLSPATALPSRLESRHGAQCPTMDAELRNQICSAALDRLAHGVVMLDGTGRLMLCNAAASAIFDAGEALKLVQGRVYATRPGDARRLQALLFTALAGRAADGEALVVRGTVQCAYAMTIESTRDELRQRTGAAATLYITDIRARPSALNERTLRAMFGFTPAETRIAVGIADGDAVRTVAARVGVTYESARFTLKRIYEKLGVHKQGELVALIRSALPPLRGDDGSAAR